MALPSCLLVSVGGRRSQRPGPSPTLGSLGPSHQRRHKSRVSLRGPPCAHGVSGTPHGELHDSKRVRRLRRCGTRIQESGLPLARQGEKRSATVRRSSNIFWTKGRWSNGGSDRWTPWKGGWLNQRRYHV